MDGADEPGLYGVARGRHVGQGEGAGTHRVMLRWGAMHPWFRRPISCAAVIASLCALLGCSGDHGALAINPDGSSAASVASGTGGSGGAGGGAGGGGGG